MYESFWKCVVCRNFNRNHKWNTCVLFNQMDKRGKVEYFKQVNSANHNVINALKPYIADRGLPDIKIFEALIASTAREFGVDKKDMFSVSVYCEELIKEIISDVYVSNQKKQEYTNSLAEYKQDIEKSKDTLSDLVQISSLSSSYGERIRHEISLYISMVTAILGMCCSILIFFYKEETELKILWYPFDENPIMWVPILLLLLVAFTMIMVRTMEIMIRILKRNRRLLTRKDSGEDNE